MKREPLVTLSRSVWRGIIQVCTAAPEGEVLGYLVGRFTHVGARVHYGVVQEQATGNSEHVWVADEDSAAMEKRLLKQYAPLECVGLWHSHVFEEPCASFVLPQLSDRDELTTAMGALEFIVTVMPTPTDQDLMAVLRKPSEFHLQREYGGYLCRAEVWLRACKAQIVPCRLKLR